MPRNIVLIVVDTLRAKNLPCYGYGKNTAPFLTAMAKKYTKIDQYYSTSPWTVPAHASLFTGKLPSEHGSTTQDLRFKEPNTLVQKLKEEGYKTYGISENPLISPVLRFDKDFDYFYPMSGEKKGKVWRQAWRKDAHFDSQKDKWIWFLKEAVLQRDLTSLKSFLEKILSELLVNPKREDFNPSSSQKTINKAERLLNRPENVFLFLNLMPVHAPYTFTEEEKAKFLPATDNDVISQITSPDTFKDYLENGEHWEETEFNIRESAYDASIKYVDTLIEYLWENSPEDSLFIIIGDHGELIGEYEYNGHGLINHHFGTYLETIQVPCIIFPSDEVEPLIKDHRTLYNWILSEDTEHEAEENPSIFAEYYGKSGFNQQFETEVPSSFQELYNRKSLSVMTEKWKYDLTSDGEYLWQINKLTEQEDEIEKNQDIASSLREMCSSSSLFPILSASSNDFSDIEI